MQVERRSLKKSQGFNGIRTRDLRDHDTGAMLYQLSSEATHWERELPLYNVLNVLSLPMFEAFCGK